MVRHETHHRRFVHPVVMDAHVARYPSFWISKLHQWHSRVRDQLHVVVLSPSQFAGKLRQQLYPFRPMLPPLRSRPGRATLRVSILPLLFLVIPLRGRMNRQRHVYIRILRVKRAHKRPERIDRHRVESRRQHRLELLQQPLSFHVVCRGCFLHLHAFLQRSL